MDGSTLGAAIALIKKNKPTDEQIESAVSDWLDDHPEATTTVQDGSITKAKLDENLQGTVDDVSDLKNEIDSMNTATSGDVGKALSPKTVSGGKVTEWEFINSGGGGGGADIDDDAGEGVTDKTWSANKLYSMEERIADLEYEPLTLNSLSVSPNLAEIGSTVSSATLTYSMNKDAEKMKLDDADIQNTSASGTISLTGLSLSSNKTWTLKAQDERQQAESEWVSKTATLTFTNKVKYGVASEPEAVNDTFLNGLPTRTLSTGKVRSFNVNAGSGQYIWYALPSSYGTCTFTVGGFSGGFSLVDTFNHVNESGATVEYRVYRSDNDNLGSTSVAVA